jgi:hypothetical protein
MRHFLLSLVLCWKEVGAGSIFGQARSGAAVGIIRPGYKDAKNAKWILLNFAGSSSKWHSGESCPGLMNCNTFSDIRDHFQLGSGAVIQGVEWERTLLPFPQYADVHGELGIGPNSLLGQSKIIFFSERQSDRIMNVYDSTGRGWGGQVFQLSGTSSSWTVGGSLKINIPKIAKFSLKEEVGEISFDFRSADISIPDSHAGLYTQRNSWTILESRLYVACEKEGLKSGGLLELTLENRIDLSVRLPVVAGVGFKSLPGKSNMWGNRMQQCATNIVFNTANRVVIGSSILKSFDVAFDGRNSLVRLIKSNRHEKMLVEPARWPFVSRRYGARAVLLVRGFSTFSVDGTTWKWNPSAKPIAQSDDFYLKRIPRVDDAEPFFEILCLGIECKVELERFFSESLAANWMGFPAFSLGADNAVTVTDKRDWMYRIFEPIEWQGNLGRVRIITHGYRMNLDMKTFVRGQLMELRPATGAGDYDEIVFRHWPPVLGRNGCFPLAHYGRRNPALMNAITRWHGDVLIEETRDHNLILRAEATGAPRSARLDINELCFG